MAKILEAIVEIDGRDKTGNLFSKIGNKAEVADRKLKAIGNRHVIAAQRARGLVSAMGELAVGLSAVEVVRNSVKNYMDLERTMTDLGITAGATDAQIKVATKTLQDQAPAIGQTGQQWGEVAQNLVAAGMGFNDAIGATPIIARTAKAEAADMVEVSAAANAAMQNLGVTVGGLGKAMDMMAAGGKAGSFELKDMAAQFPSVAASASRLGFQGTDGIARLVAMLEVSRKTAGQAEQAATNMRQAFDKMYSPTVVKAFGKTFGKSLPSILKAAVKSGKNQFEAVLDFIDAKTKKMNDTDKQGLIGKVFNDEQARNGILAMLRFKDEYKSILGELQNSQGTVDSDLKRRLDTTAGHWDRAMASLNRSMAKFGEALAPGVAGFADDLERLIGKFGDLKSSIETTGGVLRGFYSGLSGGDGNRKDGKAAPNLWNNIADFEKAIGQGLRNVFGDWNSGMKPRTAPNEAFRGRRLWKTDNEAAEGMGKGIAVAVTGGKLPQPRSDEGIDVTLPYGLSKAVGVLDEALRRLERGGPADGTNPKAEPGTAYIGGDLRKITAKYGDQAATPPEYLARNPGWTPPSSGRDAPSDPTQPAQPVPVDVTGKVSIDPASKVAVEVRVKVDGPGAVTGMSATAGGNAKANVGVSGAGHLPRRDE